MSNVPHPTFSTIGVSAPAESSIKTGWWADFQDAFDGKLNESDATPQGQLIAALTALVGGNNDLFLEYVNQVDPALASGRMQDAIARIYFLTRQAALPTTVMCDCTGAIGTVIPMGALAQATDGTTYQSTAELVIPAGGTISGTFTATVPGPIYCPAGTLGTIYRVIPGWDTINNPQDGVPGRDIENRSAFENRRAQSVASNASGILPAIRGAVLSAPGVVDAYVTENSTASAITIGGKSIAARSLFVSVFGGADADVARAIWTRKPPGCGYVGNTTVAVKDDVSGYSLPYPSYNVSFERPTALPIYFAVSVANSALVPADAIAQIRSAIVSAFNGLDGGQRAKIGATLYATRFVAGVAGLGTWAQILSVAIGTTASPTGTNVTVNIDKIPTLDPANIAVTLV